MELTDFEQVRREVLRWMVLVVANTSDSSGVTEAFLKGSLAGHFPVLPSDVLRHEVRYLEGRGYLHVHASEAAPWRAVITANGVDLVEYRAECPASIARPKRSAGI